MEIDSQDAEEGKNEEKQKVDVKAEGDESKSPPKKKMKKLLPGKKKPKFVGGQPGPLTTTLLDLGGAGDCAWRAIAVQVALYNQKTSGASIESLADKADLLGTSLRVKSVAYLKAHKNGWIGNWVQDPLATHLTEAGEPATNAADFLKSLDRPQRGLWAHASSVGRAQMSLYIARMRKDGPE